jgi:Cupin domain
MDEGGGTPGDGIVHVRAGEGRLFWGPGTVTGSSSRGASRAGLTSSSKASCPRAAARRCTPTCGRKSASFLLEGRLSSLVGDRTIDAGAGDLVHFPRGVPHSFRNNTGSVARMLAIFSPAGMEGWFEAALDAAEDAEGMPPPATAAMIARMLGAGPRFGVEWAAPDPAGSAGEAVC